MNDFNASELANGARGVTDFESEVLRRLQQSIGFDVAYIGALNEVPTTIGLDGERLVEISRSERHVAQIAPWKEAALKSGGVAVDTTVFGERGVRNFDYFRKFAKPVNGRHSLMGLMMLRGEVIGGVMLGRAGECAKTFSDAEVERVSEALPSIALARASFGWPKSRQFVSRPLPSPASVLSRVFRGGQVAKQSNLTIRDRNGYRDLIATNEQTTEEMVWSRASVQNPSRSGWPYIDLFHVAASRAANRNRALFIGGGGAVSPRQFAECYPGIKLDVVEPNSAVIDLATTFYALDEIPNFRMYEAEGTAFLRETTSQWNIIIIDAYDANNVVEETMSREFFEQVRRALTTGGAFAFNLVTTLNASALKQLIATAESANLVDLSILPVVDRAESYSASSLRNVVVVGSAR